MARFEMDGAGLAGMAPVDLSGADCYELGLSYAAGRVGAPDLVEAHKWLNIAVARGCREAAPYRAELAREMDAIEIARAQREARLWLGR